MLISHVWPSWLDVWRVHHKLLITNLEAVPLTFRLRVTLKVVSSGNFSASLPTHLSWKGVELWAEPPWSRISPNLYTTFRDAPVQAKETHTVELNALKPVGPGPHPFDGRGYIELRLPASGEKKGSAPQLDHPARVLVSVFADTYSGMVHVGRAPQPLASSAAEILIPPESKLDPWEGGVIPGIGVTLPAPPAKARKRRTAR